MPQQTVVTTSKRFNLKLSDWAKSLIVAMITGPVTVILDSLNEGSLTFDWKKIAIVAISAGLSYILKNWLSPAQIVIKNASPEVVQAVKEGDKEVKVVRVVQAFECGAIVNPHHLENQVMGSIVQALGGALFEAVEFANGKIINSALSAYRVPRFSDIPKIEIILIDRKDLASAGAGEAGIVGVAPAIRNAILNATGKALNNLPMLPNGMLA